MGRLALAALPFAFIPALAAAQPSAAPTEPPDRAGQPLLPVPPGPAGRSENFVSDTDFDLEISEDESKATVTFGGYTTRNVTSRTDESQTDSSWAFRLSLPIGGHDDLTEGSTFDSLLDGPRLGFTYTFFGFDAADIDSAAFRRIMAAARANCAREAASAAKENECNNAPPDRGFALDHSGASRRDINRALFSGLWRIGFDGSVGIDSFDFVDAGTLAEHEETELYISAAIFGAWYPNSGDNAWLVRAEYESEFEGEDATVVCRPVVVTPADDCVHAAPARPTNVERLNLSLEHRRLLDGGGSVRFAVSPRVTYDALSDEYELELPIYLVPRADWRLLPGVRVGYSSEDDEVTVGIFLRTSFKL